MITSTPIRYGSACSGIEAASIAWESLGWVPAWFSQFDPEHNYKNGPDFPSVVLAYHWPEVVNLGDMTKIAAGIRAGLIEAPDVLVGGTPCQAFSIAGLRNGLSDGRGQLTLAFVELVNAIDEKRREQGNPRLLSSGKTSRVCSAAKTMLSDVFLQGLPVKAVNWNHQGENGQTLVMCWDQKELLLGECSTLNFSEWPNDAAVCSFVSARSGFDPAAVFFESQSLRRNSPPCRKTGAQGTSHAGKRTDSGSHWDNPANPHPTLNQSNNIGGIGQSNREIFAQRGSGLVSETQFGAELAGTLTARHDSSPCSDRGMNIVGTISAHSFTGGAGGRPEGASAGHFIPVITMAQGQSRAEIQTDDVGPTLACNQESPIVAFGFKAGQGSKARSIGWAPEQSPTLTAATSGSNLAPAIAYAFAENNQNQIRLQNGDGQITGPFSTGGGKPGQGYPAIDIAGNTIGRAAEHGGNGLGCGGDLGFTLTKTDQNGVMHNMQVRRLTPRECERLQGFPDDHTLIPYGRTIRPEKLEADYAKYLMRGGKLSFEDCAGAAADGHRYRAIANSMTVPVMHWIGCRIAEVLRA